MKLVMAFTFVLVCSQARADYSARDLAVYCSHIHDKEASAEAATGNGVCIGYLAAFAAFHHGEFGHIDMVPTADEFVEFSKSIDQSLPASTALFTMFYRKAQQGMIL